MKIPMLDLRREYEYMQADIDAAIKRCLEHQRWILGPEVEELEKEFGKYLSVQYCIGTSSGTDALVLALRALAIQRKGQEYFDRGDKIITTPFTFTATGDAILRAGATPVFVDIDPETFNIDPEQIKQALELTQGVVGILPVHLYGQACEMNQILSLAKQYNCFVVEDVAQACGAAWEGQKLGTIGDAGTFSFFPSKNLGGSGDGGMIVTNSQELAALTRELLKHGGKDKYNVEHIGYNARLDTLQAAVLLAKLEYLDEFNNKRKKIAQLYNQYLKNCRSIQLPQFNKGDVVHQYTIRILTNQRDQIQEYLKNKGVDTTIYYLICLNRMKVFFGRCEMTGKLYEANKMQKEVLSLPIEPLMAAEEIQYVCTQIKSFFN